MRVLVVAIIILQLSPLIPFLFIERYSDQELGDLRSECVDEYISREIQIYLSAEKAGKKVYGGIDKIKSDFSAGYEELCNKIVNKKYSNFDLYGLFSVLLLYTFPSTFLFKKQVENSEKPNVTLYSFAAILILFGMILYWDFGLNIHIHTDFGGRIFF